MVLTGRPKITEIATWQKVGPEPQLPALPPDVLGQSLVTNCRGSKTNSVNIRGGVPLEAVQEIQGAQLGHGATEGVPCADIPISVWKKPDVYT